MVDLKDLQVVDSINKTSLAARPRSSLSSQEPPFSESPLSLSIAALSGTLDLDRPVDLKAGPASVWALSRLLACGEAVPVVPLPRPK
jgi:hypothetical protein